MVWAYLIWVAAAGSAYAQISPGPLARAHADLEGSTKCATCHNFGLGNRGFKCLDCHAEIRRRVEGYIGYHARAYNVSAAETDCARCHLEHNGRQFAITKLDRDRFDHKALTGFALEGKHKQLKCDGCHAAAKIPATAKAEIKVKDLNHTFLGLKKECTSCHKDEHNGQFGAECLRCHSQDAWKPANGFDHNRTQFPLTGLHINTTCEKCHGPKPGEVTAKYKGLAFGQCQDCHADPHRGAFVNAKAGTCQSCHTTAGWKSVPSVSSFDHSRTKFALHGKHGELTCAQCHKNNDFAKPIAHEQCKDCHQDIHRGQFASRVGKKGENAADCAACHNDVKWKPSGFTRETHQTGKFKLEGKHAKLECARCHSTDGQITNTNTIAGKIPGAVAVKASADGKAALSKDAVFALKQQVCLDCHVDPHGGEFKAEPYANKCEVCHTQDVFRPSTFNLTSHGKTKFPLASAHLAVPCADCHKPLSMAEVLPDTPARKYHFADQSCTGCHVDPHRMRTGAMAGNAAVTCETCHNTREWRELRSFDHNQTKFKLEGAHQSATCIGCHRPVTAAVNARNAPKPTVDFAVTPTQCYECHDDIHGGQFMTPGKEKDCSSCHSISKWGSAEFDHSKTSYPLEGAHTQVRCAQCHTENKEINGRVTRVYSGTPTDCAACHSTAVPSLKSQSETKQPGAKPGTKKD